MNHPPALDVDRWVDLWDRMQERFLVDRVEWLAELVRLVRAQRPAPRRLLDLGCGSGSISVLLLEAFPEAEVIGIDADPTLLALARGRCARHGARACFLEADLRSAAWVDAGGAADGALSATALHWLTEEQLASLYRRLAGLLAPGALFLNADHVASTLGGIQGAWEARRAQALGAPQEADRAWREFWDGFLAALGPGSRERREAALGPFEGSEPGYPLAWHLDALRTAGFTGVDCFWRRGTDAIYGGVRG